MSPMKSRPGVKQGTGNEPSKRKKRYSIVDIYSFESNTIDKLVNDGCAEMAMLEAWEDDVDSDATPQEPASPKCLSMAWEVDVN